MMPADFILLVRNGALFLHSNLVLYIYIDVVLSISTVA